MKSTKQIITILCDDIRQEIGNKVSLMGIYSKELIVPNIPFTLPKICLMLIARDVQNEIRDLRVEVTLPQSKPMEFNVPAPPKQIIPQDIQIGITVAPLNIISEGDAKIEVFQKSDAIPIVSHNFILKKAN